MVKRILRKTSKIFTIIVLIIAIIVGIGIAFGKVYEEEIQNYVISEINSKINVKISLESADFSLFKKFPYISVVLSNVNASSGSKFNKSQFKDVSTDTLFSASRIYLQFNIIEIIRKDYSLKRVHAENGKFNILVDKAGLGNYLIFNESSSNQKSDFTLGIDGVKISGFSWHFLNLSKKISSTGVINDLALKGNFSQNNFSLNTKTSLYVEVFNREGINYASNLKLNTHIILDVKDSLYSINKGDLILNDLLVKIGGSITGGSKILLNVQIAGENLNIKSLLNTLPINLDSLNRYSPEGKAEFLAKINGEISSTEAPSIKAAFKVSNGILILSDYQSSVRGIAFKGTYSNGSKRNASTSRINLSEFQIKFNTSLLNGNLSLSNFINPYFSGTIGGSVSAKEISEILNLESWTLNTGVFYPDVSINMNISSFKDFDLKSISPKGLVGKINFKDVSGKTPYSKIPVDQIEGSIRIEGDIWVPRFQVKMGRNKFSANLIANNLWQYFVNHSAIPEISGEILAEQLNITDFLPESNSDEDLDFHLPDSINLDLHCVVDTFNYGKFYATDFDAWFKYEPKVLSVSSFKMQTMSGQSSGNGVVIEDNSNQMLLRTSLKLSEVDINQLFYAFNNFSQTFIVSENLKGSISGNLDFSAYISPKLELLTKDLTAQSDFTIKDGELINFEPITELSTYIELSELQHIRFSTLKNSILIKDEKVFIPQMDIKSSAFNISVSGTHGFDNYFEYRMRLSLNEILAKKVKRPKKTNEEFGLIEDDGGGKTNIYLSIIGTPDDFKVKYDKKEAINKVKSDLKQEKKLLKTILKEELGLFKTDTLSTGKIIRQSDKNQFIMDWNDEESPPAKTPEKSKKNQKKEPALKVSWDDEDAK